MVKGPFRCVASRASLVRLAPRLFRVKRYFYKSGAAAFPTDASGGFPADPGSLSPERGCIHA